ncbi:MAG: CNNM domain-containing protein, partial [Thermoleophilaceae bacterium]
MDLVLLLIVVPALIALNGLFVAAEYALVRSRLDRIDQLAEEGARGAPLARRQIQHIDQYIAACQVGITLASIGIGAIGEPVVAHYLDKPLGGPLSHGAATVIAAIVAYMLISAAHITFGELTPKIYTVARPEGVARRLSRPLEFSNILFRPVAMLLS